MSFFEPDPEPPTFDEMMKGDPLAVAALEAALEVAEKQLAKALIENIYAPRPIFQAITKGRK